MTRGTKSAGLPSAGAMLLGGCSPSVTAFGAYFPAWLLCALLGLLAAIVTRIAFVATGMADAVPAQFFVCAAAGVIVASLCWLIWIG